ncbi:hypothetical protein VZO05_05240 [Aggregatilineales bacterium SYSU G02658]
MLPLKSIVYEHWLSARREKIAAAALSVTVVSCQVLQTYKKPVTHHDELPLNTNFLIVFEDRLPLTPNRSLLELVRKHDQVAVVVLVDNASNQFRAKGWRISAIDLESLDLSEGYSEQLYPVSGEFWSVVLAAVVALSLLVIIAISILPAAPVLP